MTYRLKPVDPQLTARLRRSIFAAVGLLAVSGCATRTLDPDPDGGDDAADDDDGGVGTTGTATGSESDVGDVGSASGDSSVGGDSSTGDAWSDDGANLECVDGDLSWGQVTMCRPAEGVDCSTCVDDCVPQAQALADEAGYGPCGGWADEVEVVCGEVIGGNCCQLLELWDLGCAGRPFSVAGEARVAQLAARDDWSASVRPVASQLLSADQRRRLAEHWRDAARAEHASVAAFARFALDLLALGAPPSLLDQASRAMADEVEHARLCFALASGYATTTYGPGPLHTTGAVRGDRRAEQILDDAIIEGCIEETIAAAIASVAAAMTRDRAVARVLRTIAADEERHAALSWTFVRWLQRQRPDLQGRADASFERGLARAVAMGEGGSIVGDESDSILAEHGCLPAAIRHAVARSTIRDIIEPAWRGLRERATG